MKRYILSFSIAACLLMLLCSSRSEAQQISKTKLELRAKHNFLNEKYEIALADFRLLYNNYPKDEEYNYFLGRCLLNTNRELEFAIDLLKYASINGERADAHFYLGEAYKKLYRLDDAYISYTTFIQGAGKAERKRLDADYELKCVERMISSTTQGQRLEVLNKKEVQDVAFEKGYENVIEGTIIHKPDEFILDKDRETGYEGLMYLPESLDNGNYIYFAGYEENLKGGKQIFRVKKISENEYTFPEPLPGIINTDLDEEYPFYDVVHHTLYFSSKGHYSFGGYDIFKSTYNSMSDTWSQPEQLDFPVNTPFDDYLYVINPEKEKAVFASNRESKTKKLTVYTIEAAETPEYVQLNKPEEKKDLALLAMHMEEVPEDIPEEQMTGDNYADVLFYALNYQSDADSLLMLLREKRGKAINTDNEDERKVLLVDIDVIEKEYRITQNHADELFDKANAMKPEDELTEVSAAATPATNTTDQNENIALKEEFDDIKVYEFVASTASSTSASQPIKSDKLALNQPKEEKKLKKKEFEILSYEPYNSNNPIPTNTALPDGLVYRIQLGAFSNVVNANAFKGLFPVSAENMHNTRVTKYYVGYFSNSVDARKALERVKDYGYPDAFLVPFFDNEKISISKAKEIEFDQNKF